MLTLYGSSGTVPLKCDDYYIKELASGYNELVFEISIWDPAYQEIQEQGSIKEASDNDSAYYQIKAIDGGGDKAQVKCILDLDEWRSAMYSTYEATNNTIGEIVTAVKPAGWTVVNLSQIIARKTFTLEGVTPLGVLDACRDVYNGITYQFDTDAKIVTIVNMDGGTDLGAFVMRDLNLRKCNYKGKSTNFITRLYAVGKDGLTFASINDGKAYVDNNTYSNRVISAYWKDERYTDKASLLADATAQLAELAIPQRSFECDVSDLAAIDPSKYGYLSFPLFSRVSLIDETRSAVKIAHKVAERWRYPYRPDKNKVVLSTAAPRIQSQVVQIAAAINNINSVWNQERTAEQLGAIISVTTDILGANGGAVRLLDTNDDGYPDTLYVADHPDPSQAHYVWRWNYQGWGASTNGFDGPFTLAATINSGIVADFITAGTLNAGVVSVTNLNASNITTGTLSAARIAANSIAVSKLTGSIINGDWSIDLDNGTLTIGSISANNITAGTINADNITVTNINGQNIKGKTIGSSQLDDDSVVNRVLAGSSVSNAKVLANTLTTGSMSAGVQSALAGGDLADSVFNYGTTASFGSFTRLFVNGEQFTKQLFQFTDGNGQTIQGYFLMLYTPI